MKTDDAPEIIEILDDDTSAFGERPARAASHDTGGPRWVGPVAGAVLVGLIAFAVATSSSSPGTPDVAPASSTTAAPQATNPAPTTTVPAEPPVPYYAAEPPRDYQLQFAQMMNPDDVTFGDTHYQLWAQPGASATSGSWFTIDYFEGQTQVMALNARRVETERGAMVIGHQPSGQSLAQLADQHGTLTVTSLGWTDDDLLRLVQSVTTDGGDVTITDSTLTAGYELLSTTEPWLVVRGVPIEQVYYVPIANPLTAVSVTVALLPELSGQRVFPDRRVLLPFMIAHATSFTVDGRSAVAGEAIDSDGYSMATWVAGDHIVTVSGTMPVPDLVDIARTVHTVSDNEWKGMQFQAIKNAAGPPAIDHRTVQARPVPVSFGTDATGASWVVRVSVDTFGTQQQVTWQGTGFGFGTTPLGSAQIGTLADQRRTYVVGDLPRAVAASAELHVLRDGLDPVVVPFNDIDPTLDRTFAAYVFSEPVPYHAEIVGLDDALLAYWSSST